MLALSRKRNESIMISNNIEVTVLEIKGEQVKIGISAPKEIPVYRREVYLQIHEANKEAITSVPSDAFKDLFKEKDDKGGQEN